MELRDLAIQKLHQMCEDSKNDYIKSLENQIEELKNVYVNIYKRKDVLTYEYDKETLTSMVCELQDRLNKASRFIVKNAIASDKWEEIEPLEFIPVGNITYKSLSKNKVQELDKIIKGE